ncbi:hypothetical protein ABHN03_25315 [Paenibacillus sp. NRS-1775]|uniref:hypothetical protein n=1 Tax=unclassified Paenibacillus TaxID=185978 RepID=UPI003D2B5ED4
MKSIIKARTTKKVYFMGKDSSFYWGISMGDEELKYNDKSLSVGRLEYKEIEDSEFPTLKETEAFHKLLDEGEIINISGNQYEIAKVIHWTDGTMEYWVDVEYDDEKSKANALRQLELRKSFLEGRKVESEKVKGINIEKSSLTSDVVNLDSNKTRKFLNMFKKVRS